MRYFLPRARYAASTDRWGLRTVLGIFLGVGLVAYGALELTGELRMHRRVHGTVEAFTIDAEEGMLRLMLRADDGEFVAAHSRIRDAAAERFHAVHLGDRVHLTGRGPAERFVIYEAIVAGKEVLDTSGSRRWVIGRALAFMIVGLMVLGLNWGWMEVLWVTRERGAESR